MSEPFLGQITMFGGNFAPRGWAFCNGQILAISSNESLFSLLGTTYGGDGRSTFGLPDLRGRSPKHKGRGPGLRDVRLGEKGGRERHTISLAEMPSHSHTATLHAERSAATVTNPKGSLLASAATYTKSDAAKDNKDMSPESITVNAAGGNQSFNIENPYQAVNFIIALQGTFPSRS